MKKSRMAATTTRAPADARPRITVERFVGPVGEDYILNAFVAEEKRLHGTRKLPREEWEDELARFKSAPRTNRSL